MKRLLVMGLLLTACVAVQPVRIAIPATAVAVEGANPRVWNQPISFGDWRTASVNEGTTRSFLFDLGILDVGKTDQAYRMVLQGPGQQTDVECHMREVIVGSAGVFVQASLGKEPILVCGLSRKGYRTVLALTRTGRPEPSLVGELRQVGGATYDVRSIHRAATGGIPSGEPFGYEIVRDERALAVVETVNRGRVWIDPDAPNRDDLAAAAAALLLWTPSEVEGPS
ncbi:MAG TPA: hypothetical protein VF432_14360 [Thermoanaerobaculia bacterium]